MKKSTLEVNGKKIPLYSLNTLIIGSGDAALNAAVSLYKYGQKDIAIATDYWGGGTSNNAGSDKQTYYKLSVSGDKSSCSCISILDHRRYGYTADISR